MGQDVEADASVVVNIRVEHISDESDFWWLVRVVFSELDNQIEDTSLPNAIVWPKDDCLPLEERVT